LSVAREGGVIIAIGEMCAPPRIAAFDLDATLIACEFIDEVAVRRGLAHLTRPLTESAMSGRIGFRESYLRRLEILRGTPVDEIERLIEDLPLAPGAARTISALRAAECRIAIITGGYARLGRAVQKRLGIDALYATELEERDGCLTGRPAGPLLDEDGKAEAFLDFCRLSGYTPREAMAVGDGANDLKMLATAGLAVLYTSLSAPDRRIESLDTIMECCSLSPRSMDLS
jgi:phosphoserine phosphatase